MSKALLLAAALCSAPAHADEPLVSSGGAHLIPIDAVFGGMIGLECGSALGVATTDFVNPALGFVSLWPLGTALVARAIAGLARMDEPSLAIAPMKIHDGYGVALTAAF